MYRMIIMMTIGINKNIFVNKNLNSIQMYFLDMSSLSLILLLLPFLLALKERCLQNIPYNYTVTLGRALELLEKEFDKVLSS